MKIHLEGFGIVVLGEWNRQIFSPDWLKKYVCDDLGTNIEVALSLGNLSAPVRFSFEGFYFLVGSNRLDIKPQNFDNDSLEKCTAYLKKILSLLSHTPVKSLGVNCSFISNGDEKEIQEKFIFGDLAHINVAEYKMKHSEIKRSFIRKDESTLNFNILLNDKNVTTSFNYHWDVTSTEQCIQKLTEKTYKEYCDMSVEFLEDTFAVEVELE